MKYIIPPKIKINCSSGCQLNCKFCAKRKTDIPSIEMCMGEFSEVVKKLTDFGIREYEISPVVGEAFMDRYINERIQLLNSYDVVERIKIFTNLLELGPIKPALDCPKVELNIYVYGDNPSRYRERAGLNLYYLFVKNFRSLMRYVYKNRKRLTPRIVIHKRFSGGENVQPNFKDPNDVYLWLFYAKLMKIKIWNVEDDTNWGKVLTGDSPEPMKDENREGICRNALENNCVFPGGDISMCGLFDINKTMAIGNIHKQSLKEIYSLDSLFMKWLKMQDEKQYFSKCLRCSVHEIQPLSTVVSMKEIYGNYVSDDGKL